MRRRGERLSPEAGAFTIILAGADREVAATQADALQRAVGARGGSRLTIPGADHSFTAPGSAFALAEAIQSHLP